MKKRLELSSRFFLVDEIVNQTNTDESEKAIDTVSKVYIMCIYTN